MHHARRRELIELSRGRKCFRLFDSAGNCLRVFNEKFTRQRDRGWQTTLSKRTNSPRRIGDINIHHSSNTLENIKKGNKVSAFPRVSQPHQMTWLKLFNTIAIFNSDPTYDFFDPDTYLQLHLRQSEKFTIGLYEFLSRNRFIK